VDGSQEDRHAITGYAFLIDGGTMSWNSKQQEIVVLSTTEGEYVAATQAAKEVLWLRSFTNEVFGLELLPTTLFRTTNRPLHYLKIISTTLEPSTLTFSSISSDGSSTMARFDSSFVQPRTCLQICLLSSPEHKSETFRIRVGASRGLRGSDKFASAWKPFHPVSISAFVM